MAPVHPPLILALAALLVLARAPLRAGAPPTVSPTVSPTISPTVRPTVSPTVSPTSPTAGSTVSPTASPTVSQTASPTMPPTWPSPSVGSATSSAEPALCGPAARAYMGGPMYDCTGMKPELTRFPAILPNTTRLILNFNGITEVPAGMFGGARRLRHVWLNQNQISTLAQGALAGADALEALYLGGNRLTHVGEGVFNDAPALRRLDLSRNRLAGISDGVFRGLTAIQQLWLFGNHIARMPKTAFAAMPALQNLNLAQNNLQCTVDADRPTDAPQCDTCRSGLTYVEDPSHLCCLNISSQSAAQFTCDGYLRQFSLNLEGTGSINVSKDVQCGQGPAGIACWRIGGEVPDWAREMAPSFHASAIAEARSGPDGGIAGPDDTAKVLFAVAGALTMTAFAIYRIAQSEKYSTTAAVGQLRRDWVLWPNREVAADTQHKAVRRRQDLAQISKRLAHTTADAAGCDGEDDASVSSRRPSSAGQVGIAEEAGGDDSDDSSDSDADNFYPPAYESLAEESTAAIDTARRSRNQPEGKTTDGEDSKWSMRKQKQDGARSSCSHQNGRSSAHMLTQVAEKLSEGSASIKTWGRKKKRAETPSPPTTPIGARGRPSPWMPDSICEHPPERPTSTQGDASTRSSWHQSEVGPADSSESEPIPRTSSGTIAIAELAMSASSSRSSILPDDPTF